MNVPKWHLYLKSGVLGDEPRLMKTISAFTADSAWRKYCYQYFGALKPCRDDYDIVGD